MKEAGNKFFITDTQNYKTTYVFSESGSKYIYDMVYSFGRYEEGTGYTNPSYLYAWDQEFSIIDGGQSSLEENNESLSGEGPYEDENGNEYFINEEVNNNDSN